MCRLARVFALTAKGHLADAREEAEHLPQRGTSELAHLPTHFTEMARGPLDQMAYDATTPSP